MTTHASRGGSSVVEYLLVLGLVIAAMLSVRGVVRTNAATLINEAASQLGDGEAELLAMPL